MTGDSTFSLRTLLVVCVAACVLLLCVPVVAEVTPVKWAVLVDLQRTTMTHDGLAYAVKHYAANKLTGDGATLFSSEPTIMDSNGNVIMALSLVQQVVQSPDTFPEVIFIAETADVSASVTDMLRYNETTASILLVSVHASNSEVCDPSINTRTVCMVPRDILNVRGLLEVAASTLSWDAIAVVYGRSGYGTGVQSAVTQQVQAAAQTPTVVAEAFMGSAANDTEDDALVADLYTRGAQGVACFLQEAALLRLHAAIDRAGLSSSLFIIASREAANVLSSMPGSYTPLVTGWGALFMPAFTPAANLRESGYFGSLATGSSADNAIDEYGAFVVSHLFDGMRTIAVAGGTSSMTNLRAVAFTKGFTGSVAFDPIYFQRVQATFSLVMGSFAMDDPLLKWYVASYSSDAQVTVTNPLPLKALIPTSALHAATVCMTASTSCAEFEWMWALYAALAIHNREVTVSAAGSVNFIVTPINTGTSGVSGLSTLIPVARMCTFLTGAGRDNIDVALTPVVNEFKTVQLEYSVTNDVFTDNTYTYPYFSRAITANAINYHAYADVCSHFAWERVLLISTSDQFGTSALASMATAMARRNLYVEQTYAIDSSMSKDSISEVFNKIYLKDISRIIAVLLPLSGDDAEMFFNLVDELDFIKKYVLFLSAELCAYAARVPSMRQKLQSSICLSAHVDADALAKFNEQLTSLPAADLAEMKKRLSDGGFISQAENCATSQITADAGFAVDAGRLLIHAVETAQAAGTSLSVSSDLLHYVRNATVADGLTGAFAIDTNGDRTNATLQIDIQVPNAVEVIGTWNSGRALALVVTYDSIYWLTNSTTPPLDTFRDYSFALSAIANASPGTIVLSLLGFIGTIVVFFFCYRHYKVQKLVELTLEGDKIPVTEDVMRRLRGERREEDE